MIETTVLSIGGRKLKVPRVVKRTLQVAIAVVLAAGVLFIVIVGNGFLVGHRCKPVLRFGWPLLSGPIFCRRWSLLHS